MTTLTKKSYYIVATLNGQSFFSEGDFTEAEINKQINDFDIDEFLEEAEEEYMPGGTNEGEYAIYRQSMMTTEEALAIGYATKHNEQPDGNCMISWGSDDPEIKAVYQKRKQELQAEVEQEFGVDNDPLVCLKQFSKVVA